jgi:ribosome biogenesis GTPase / thiamine phosphate phosphatase
MLENGTMIIDTPGMRELGMWNASEGLDTAFTDIEELSRKCKFRNCCHENEPGCAVKAALERER